MSATSAADANARRSAASAAEAVIDLVHTVMHQFRSTQYPVLRDNAHDVTHMESKVMAFFARRAGATLSDLVATAAATRPSWPSW